MTIPSFQQGCKPSSNTQENTAKYMSPTTSHQAAFCSGKRHRHRHHRPGIAGCQWHGTDQVHPPDSYQHQDTGLYDARRTLDDSPTDEGGRRCHRHERRQSARSAHCPSQDRTGQGIFQPTVHEAHQQPGHFRNHLVQ